MGEKNKFGIPVYSILIISFALLAIIVASFAYSSFTRYFWSSTVPNTVGVNLVVSYIEKELDANGNGENAQQVADLFIKEHPELLEKEIVVSSEDINAICEYIRSYVNQYISFAAAIMALLITTLSVAVPIMNYVFVWKDQLAKASNELTQLKKQAEQHVKTLSDMVTKANASPNQKPSIPYAPNKITSTMESSTISDDIQNSPSGIPTDTNKEA